MSFGPVPTARPVNASDAVKGLPMRVIRELRDE